MSRRYLYIPNKGPRLVREDCCDMCEKVNDCPKAIPRCCPEGVKATTCRDCQPCDAFRAPVFRTALEIVRGAA